MKVSGIGGEGGTSTTSSPSVGFGAGTTFGGGEGTVTTEYLLNSKSSFKRQLFQVLHSFPRCRI
ncbi:MAG: hypothetical protein IPH34_09830 [Chitinophagaceae bacterium]|nr:hypothetical protein [Chitinophagaceae bacterium]